MIRPISIDKSGVELELNSGKYRIYILGGWSVSLGKFSITFKNKSNNEKIECKRTIFGAQAYAYNTRAKKIFVVDIIEASTYQIIFENPESLIVKRSNLPFFSNIFSAVRRKDIRVLVTKSSGFSTFIK